MLLCTLFAGTVHAEEPYTDDETDSPASGESLWPQQTLTGTPVVIKEYPKGKEDYRRQAYLGPDKNKYPGAGAYRTLGVTDAKALFREGDYFFVDLLYHGREKRMVYFLNDSLLEIPDSLEPVTLTGIPAVLGTEAVAMMGPGEDYRVLEISVKSKYLDSTWAQLEQKFSDWKKIRSALRSSRYTVILEKDTEVSVFFEYNGWLFAEFGTEIGNGRAWLPADSVTT